jgi:hypothetical protein
MFAGTDDQREVCALFTKSVAKQGINTVLKVLRTEVLQDKLQRTSLEKKPPKAVQSQRRMVPSRLRYCYS